MAIDLFDTTFKKINTVGQLRKVLESFRGTNIKDSTPIAMLSDEEGNSVNGILALEFDGKNINLIPWEGKFGDEEDGDGGFDD